MCMTIKLGGKDIIYVPPTVILYSQIRLQTTDY